MERILNKPIRDEKGQALIIVLILLVIGGLIIGPLLGFMSTGLIVGRAYEERMDELYAADAGIEDAVWKIMNSEPLVTPYYDLPELVNGKQVRVTPPSENTMEAFFVGMLNLPPGQENAQHPHGTGQEEWMVVYSSPGLGTYEIIVTYVGTAQKKQLSHLGAWLYGEIYTYEEGSASGITTASPTNYSDPGSGYEKYYGGGSAFIWDLTPRVWFNQDETRTQTFEFTLLDGSTPSTEPKLDVGWAGAQSNDIWITWSGSVEMNQLTATAATDLTTGKSTTVESYIFSEDTGEEIIITILTWDVSLQQE